jgi:hypothetical protein
MSALSPNEPPPIAVRRCPDCGAVLRRCDKCGTEIELSGEDRLPGLL